MHKAVEELRLARSLFGPGADLDERLDIILEVLRAMSRAQSPGDMAVIFGGRVAEYVQMGRFMALSRREEDPPYFRITRYTGWEDSANPWTERDRLPLLQGGFLGELLYGDEPRIVDDPVLTEDDAARPYLGGVRSLMAIPQFHDGYARNMAIFMSDEAGAYRREHLLEYLWTFNLFGRAIHYHVLRGELEQAYETVDREMKVVQEIQRSLLPKTQPEIPCLELAVFYETASRAGGDYYDFFELSGGQWGIFIADVCGHGASAAVLMAITHAIAHADPQRQESAAGFLDYLNRNLYVKYTSDSRAFVTAYYAIFDPRTKTLSYASAGHDPARLYRPGALETIELESPRCFPLGVGLSERYRESAQELATGDIVVFYTDGFTELRQADGQQFGTDRMDAATKAAAGRADAVMESITKAAKAFAGSGAHHDDQTIVVAAVT